MGLLKNKKGEKTGFGKFLDKVGSSFPDIAEDILDVATSGNPIGVIIDKAREGLQKAVTDKQVGEQKTLEAEALLAQLEQESKDWELEVFKVEVEDKKRASAMYGDEGSKDISDELARQIFKYNNQFVLGAIGCAFIVNLSVALAVPHDLQAIVFGALNGPMVLLGVVVRGWMAEREQVGGFYWGSSIGSKDKQKELGKAKLITRQSFDRKS